MVASITSQAGSSSENLSQEEKPLNMLETRRRGRVAPTPDALLKKATEDGAAAAAASAQNTQTVAKGLNGIAAACGMMQEGLGGLQGQAEGTAKGLMDIVGSETAGVALTGQGEALQAGEGLLSALPGVGIISAAINVVKVACQVGGAVTNAVAAAKTDDIGGAITSGIQGMTSLAHLKGNKAALETRREEAAGNAETRVGKNHDFDGRITALQEKLAAKDLNDEQRGKITAEIEGLKKEKNAFIEKATARLVKKGYIKSEEDTSEAPPTT